MGWEDSGLYQASDNVPKNSLHDSPWQRSLDVVSIVTRFSDPVPFQSSVHISIKRGLTSDLQSVSAGEGFFFLT